MHDVSRCARLGVLAVCSAVLCAVATGCAASAPNGRQAAPATFAEATTSVASSADATAVASADEVRRLLARFDQPEEAGDPGYELLGKEHNDIAAWTRGVVLAHTDYGRLVRSLVSQQGTIPTAALAAFDRRLISTGATQTYDSVIGSQWRLERRVTKEDEHLAALIPASTVMGLLFDRQGRLLEAYEPKALSVSGTVARATFTRPGAEAVDLEFELERDTAGGLRIVGWKNYAQFKHALKGDETVDGLP